MGVTNPASGNMVTSRLLEHGVQLGGAGQVEL